MFSSSFSIIHETQNGKTQIMNSFDEREIQREHRDDIKDIHFIQFVITRDDWTVEMPLTVVCLSNVSIWVAFCRMEMREIH